MNNQLAYYCYNLKVVHLDVNFNYISMTWCVSNHFAFLLTRNTRSALYTGYMIDKVTFVWCQLRVFRPSEVSCGRHRTLGKIVQRNASAPVISKMKSLVILLLLCDAFARTLTFGERNLFINCDITWPDFSESLDCLPCIVLFRWSRTHMFGS